jgi:hypothetical protein
MATTQRRSTARRSTALAPKAKPPAKAAAKAAKAPTKAAAKAAPAAAKGSAELAPSKNPLPKPAKPKKPKLVRDSFTMPKGEYAAIETLKRRATGLGRSPKKSELLRAGLMVLSSLTDSALGQALAKVPAIKTGRPKT